MQRKQEFTKPSLQPLSLPAEWRTVSELLLAISLLPHMAFSQVSTWGNSAASKVKNGVKENNRREQMHQSILGDGVAQLSSLIQMYHHWGVHVCGVIWIFMSEYAHKIISARLLAQSEK